MSKMLFKQYGFVAKYMEAENSLEEKMVAVSAGTTPNLVLEPNSENPGGFAAYLAEKVTGSPLLNDLSNQIERIRILSSVCSICISFGDSASMNWCARGKDAGAGSILCLVSMVHRCSSLPNDVADLAAEGSEGSAEARDASYAVATKALNEVVAALAKRDKAFQDLAELQKVAELRPNIYQEGWIACFTELDIFADHPVWTKAASESAKEDDVIAIEVDPAGQGNGLREVLTTGTGRDGGGELEGRIEGADQNHTPEV
ncbi:hypothetical protein Acr_00g0008640 [Actinidia rufa]|uniref:Uncharacterized protein n=1 Tax=Actinidia rufa TaxID=165716 RepID=A0A7J0D8P4_9ERIC|nr:hypothetical protein Acr_00g0008640 [Actinidia rufa]